MRLITQQQYVNTLSYIFGPDLPLDTRFPLMTRREGLVANSSAIAGVTGSQLEQYQRTASMVADAVTGADYRASLMPCRPADADAADAKCAAEFLGIVGRLIYRKPLPAEKLKQYVQEANAGAERTKDFYYGLSASLEAMLLSPDVLFITDSYEPDPASSGKMRLDAFSLAQRLSFFLWNAAPDAALLDAAESGELRTPKGLERVVDMMLSSPRLEVGMRAFFDDMMGFDAFDNLAKDGEIYPAFSAATVADAREQTLRTIVNHLIVEKKDYRDLYITRETFMSQPLGAIYGVATTTDGTWEPYEFSQDSGRSGILTHVSFLALHAHPGRSSPTLRGKALREILLCQRVPTPPPNVDFTSLENPSADLHTQRDRVNFHLQNPVCAGCHKITDPMGLALEQFDGAGFFRTAERGYRIDPSGSLDGQNFEDAVGLSRALRDHPGLASCLVRRVYSYGVGGPDSPDDRPVLEYLNSRFAQLGYRLPGLLRTIVLSPMFSQVIPAASEGSGQTASAEPTLTQNLRQGDVP